MRQALELAHHGLGGVEPNPLVGCVLVAGNQLIGRGFHERFGGPHAERQALADARQAGRAAQLRGCTAYVTLEPCCHHGKTPPCTDALLEAGVARVVVAMLDPFAKVSGQGVAQLRAAGVEVLVGVESAAAAALNAPYLKRIQQGRPWVIAKWAMSLDGKIAAHTGQSQWISNAHSRRQVHLLRSRVDAILVGIGTALADDPLLTARDVPQPPRRALRVVVDSTLQLPLDSRLVHTADQFPTLLWAGPDAPPDAVHALEQAGCEVRIGAASNPHQRLDQLLCYLARERQVTNLLVEGGSKLLGSLLEMQQIDQCDVYLAPKLIGGTNAASPLGGIGFDHVDAGPQCTVVEVVPLEGDLRISCRLSWPFRG